MELMTGLEPVTSSLPRKCATSCATSADLCLPGYYTKLGQTLSTAFSRLSGRLTGSEATLEGPFRTRLFSGRDQNSSSKTSKKALGWPQVSQKLGASSA